MTERELLPWEKTVVRHLAITDPEEAKKVISTLTKETQIIGGRLVTIKRDKSGF